MQLISRFLFAGFAFVLFACSNGDKKSIIGAEFGDTSFVNEKFAGNKKAYKDVANPCDLLDKNQIASLYGVTTDEVMFDDPSRYVGNNKSCRFIIKMSDEKFDHLTGYIALQEEVKTEDDPGGIAEATGGGENWVEAWELRKMMSKSSEYINGMGKAAIWFGKKRNLLIKMDGYAIDILAPGSAFNEKEKTKNRDYKKIALEMAQSTGLL